jgi:anti-sigma B factor antagonist
MSTPSAHLSVLVGRNFACVKIAGRANFSSSPECALMDSTFLGTLAQFGLKLSAAGPGGPPGIELLNCNTRVTELLENLGALHLFKTLTGALNLPEDVKTCTPESIKPTHEQITRTCLEAHQTLMTVNPENVARFKDVTQFLAEDLDSLEKRP